MPLTTLNDNRNRVETFVHIMVSARICYCCLFTAGLTWYIDTTDLE
jgi:hypothetical protein